MGFTSVPLPALPPTCAFASAEVQEIQKRLCARRDAPRPTTWADRLQWEMSAAHSFMVDGLMRVYAYAEYAKEHDDLANYLGFADCMVGHLYLHHHFEEELIFPFIETATSDRTARLTRNVEQHHIFDKQIIATRLYLRACLAALVPAPAPSPVPALSEADAALDPAQYGLDPNAPGGFDPAVLRREMDKWLVDLTMHLDEEIGTLSPDFIGQMGEQKYAELDKAVQKHLQANDPSWFLCSVLASLPQKSSKELMQLPLPVRRLLVPLVWSGKHQALWKYTAYPEA